MNVHHGKQRRMPQLRIYRQGKLAFYTTSKNKKTMPEKMATAKFDPKSLASMWSKETSSNKRLIKPSLRERAPLAGSFSWAITYKVSELVPLV